MGKKQHWEIFQNVFFMFHRRRLAGLEWCEVEKIMTEYLFLGELLFYLLLNPEYSFLYIIVIVFF